MRISDWSSDLCSSDLMIKDDLVTDIIEGRRRPGYRPDLPDALTQDNVGALRPPPPQAFPGMEDQLPIPDRWRLIETLGVVKDRRFAPYRSAQRPVGQECVSTCRSRCSPQH